MKESVGGEVKEAPAATRPDIHNIVVTTRNADETADFEASTLRAVVIMLWERYGSKEDLDQYRGIGNPCHHQPYSCTNRSFQDPGVR